MANKNHKLIAIHEGKYYKRKDGLALGPGCFVKGLEYATGTKSILIGKPNEYFFKSALTDDVSMDECVMIGDVCNGRAIDVETYLELMLVLGSHR